MELFLNKLHKMAPVLNRQYKREIGGEVYQQVSIEGSLEDFYKSPYMSRVKEFCECGEEITNKRIFLVTDEENIGLKAAFGLMNYPIYASLDEIAHGFENPFTIRLVSMRDYTELLASTMSEKENYYFTGLGEISNDYLFDKKLKAVMSCQSSLQFVQIRKNQIDMPWARELMKSRECEIIYLPKAANSYYVEILETLLAEEKYQLEESLVLEHLVQNMRKKCWGKFGEEDIAWSLDQAVKRAKRRGEYRLLTAVDFMFDAYEELSPLHRLEQMIGLQNMKNLAWEYAALGKEQSKNEKLVDICKHVIFKGCPGTGKTMCGQILAQVMAEQGHSNGSFIVASRKDIIGEHVGQTAPKIANLFEKARNGVLFVDEAGFLLHETRASFNQEAIKEFVRYMELYQDVTVIFALYPLEVEEWMQLDAGLSSRISRIIEFEDYNENELLKITERMCLEKGYKPAKEARDIISTYIVRRRLILGDEFGNAREMRKLVEAAIIARSLRCYEKEPEEKEPMLTVEDFEYGVKRLHQNKDKKATRIGFAIA